MTNILIPANPVGMPKGLFKYHVISRGGGGSTPNADFRSQGGRGGGWKRGEIC